MKNLLWIVLAMPLTVMASPKDIVMLLDALCMSTEGEIAVIQKMVQARGGKELSSSMINADPAVARYGGKGFTLKVQSNTYALMVTNNGACSLLSQGISRAEVKILISNNYPVTKMEEDSSGGNISVFGLSKLHLATKGGLLC